MILNSDSHARRQYLQCAAFLALAYILVYGWLLVSTNFLPYVMDNNESFSSYWHAINLAQFDFFKSFGLTDEAYGFSAAAHPYVYTHQGNFPRLFNFLIYALGAHSIESQITVTTFTVGVAAIFMGYHFFCKIANPLFALVCCLLLITDYVLIAQWQVVTYRVWHGFFIFSSMLCVHRMVEGRRFWMAATVINFACLFYYEFIFVAFVSLASALYAAFLCRHEPKKLIGFWGLQAVGGGIALSILAIQLYLYLGWADLKMDAYLTFVARNHFQDSVELLKRMEEFFDSRNIVFWYNLEDGSRFRSIGYFLASLLYFEFQVHTPLLSTLSLIALLVLISALTFRAVNAAVVSDRLGEVGKVLGGARQLIFSTPVRAGLMLSFLHLFHRHNRGDFGSVQLVELIAIAVAVVIGVALVEFLPRFQGAHRAEVVRKISWLLALTILVFNLPSVLNHVSAEPILLDQYSTFFMGYILIFVLCFAWILWGIFLSGPTDSHFQVGVSFYRIASLAVIAVSFLSFLGFFVTLFGKNLIFGIQSQTQQWFEAAGLGYFYMALFAAACATALLQYVAKALATAEQPSSGISKSEIAIKLKVSIFVLLATLLIAGSWKLYNPRYDLLWLEMVDAILPAPLPYVLVTLVLALGSAAVLARTKVFDDLGITNALRGCAAFLLAGFLAYTMVYVLSPGYIFSGYRFRQVPFTAFHTVVLMAFSLYVLLVVGLNYLKGYRTQRAEPGLGVSGAANQLKGGRTGALRGFVGLASLATLAVVSVYWAGVQLSYIRLLPPNHYSFLDKLSKPPYVGNGFLVNTYAAPIAAKTGTWAYLDDKLMFPKLEQNDGRYEIPFNTTYLWFADKRSNPEYTRPGYFLCVAVQSTSTMIDEIREQNGLGKGRPGCEENQLVQLARRGEGKNVYPSIELSEADVEGPKMVGYERWAIIKLNWAK